MVTLAKNVMGCVNVLLERTVILWRGIACVLQDVWDLAVNKVSLLSKYILW